MNIKSVYYSTVISLNWNQSKYSSIRKQLNCHIHKLMQYALILIMRLVLYHTDNFRINFRIKYIYNSLMTPLKQIVFKFLGVSSCVAMIFLYGTLKYQVYQLNRCLRKMEAFVCTQQKCEQLTTYYPILLWHFKVLKHTNLVSPYQQCL